MDGVLFRAHQRQYVHPCVHVYVTVGLMDPLQCEPRDSILSKQNKLQPNLRICRLVGLHNIGQTCCLNSLIQVFVMNVDFARILKRITGPRGADERGREMLLLLEKMQDSQQKAVWPLELAYSLISVIVFLDFSQILPMKRESCDAEEQSGGQYELFAVIAHMGMADSGHYCVYIRNAVDGKWFCFNDSNICLVSWEDIQCTYGNPNYHW
uniref:USP domain-containing protein n=1 Tax=Pan troglodytes TaxID=9598 RepID=A0A2I3RD46_PANTR